MSVKRVTESFTQVSMLRRSCMIVNSRFAWRNYWLIEYCRMLMNTIGYPSIRWGPLPPSGRKNWGTNPLQVIKVVSEPSGLHYLVGLYLQKDMLPRLENSRHVVLTRMVIGLWEI